MRNTNPCGDRRGFTHPPDFMIVIWIIGILAAIAIPKFSELIRRSNEGASKGNLGAMRSGLAIFYGDHEGYYPYHPVALLVDEKYLRVLPKAKQPNYHQDSSAVTLVRAVSQADDRGGWLYVQDPRSKDWGTILANCTHTDTQGTAWTAY